MNEQLKRPPTVEYVGKKSSDSINSELQYISGFFVGAVTSGSLTFLLIKAFGG